MCPSKLHIRSLILVCCQSLRSSETMLSTTRKVATRDITTHMRVAYALQALSHECARHSFLLRPWMYRLSCLYRIVGSLLPGCEGARR